MMPMVTAVIVLSLILQIASARLAFRIASRFRRGWGWMLLATAMTLMAFRRAAVLGELWAGLPQDLVSETLGLLVSGACLMGVRTIKPVLENSYRFQTYMEMEAHRMDTLLRTLPAMVYQCRNDPQWTMEFVSAGCQELTGYKPEDLLGNRRIAYAELILPEDREKVWQEVQKALAERRPYRLAYRIRTASGETRWVWEQGAGVFDEEGEVLFLTGYITDVSTWQRIREGFESQQESWRAAKEEWERAERRLLGEVWEVHERQNESIAYEIHDGFVQQATGALLSLENYRHLRASAPQEAESFLDRAIHLIRNALDEARRLIRGLRPALLEEGGLIPALERFLTEVQTRHNIQVEFINKTKFLRLAGPIETHVFRMIQEAVRNAVRHSGSPRVAVSLSQQESYLEVEVRDWGSGFDVENIPNGHYGIQAIRERAKLLGGWAEITSRPQEGTIVRVVIPLEASPSNHLPIPPPAINPIVQSPSSNNG